MNASFCNRALILTGSLLLAANVYLRLAAAKPALAPAAAAPAVVNAKSPAPLAPAPAPPERPSPAVSQIRWEPLETDDYIPYMANLRKFGFPEALIRQIITSEIDSLYAPRLAALAPPKIPHDAPPSVRARNPTPEDIVRMRDWQKTLIEKRDQLQHLLGGHPSREMIRTAKSRNFEGHEYAVSQLPPEKQEAVRVILENQWIDEESYTAYPERLRQGGFEKEMDAYVAVHEQRAARLSAILTPDELERLNLHTMPQGSEMQREIIGMEPTPDELVQLYRIVNEQWLDNGGIYGRWRARRVPSAEIRENDRRANERISDLLGADRFNDYLRARSDMGRRLNSLGSRFGLPLETIRQAYDLQSQIDEGAFPDRREPLTQRLQETLGASVFDAWQRGRSIRPRVEP